MISEKDGEINKQLIFTAKVQKTITEQKIKTLLIEYCNKFDLSIDDINISTIKTQCGLLEITDIDLDVKL